MGPPGDDGGYCSCPKFAPLIDQYNQVQSYNRPKAKGASNGWYAINPKSNTENYQNIPAIKFGNEYFETHNDEQEWENYEVNSNSNSREDIPSEPKQSPAYVKDIDDYNDQIIRRWHSSKI